MLKMESVSAGMSNIAPDDTWIGYEVEGRRYVDILNLPGDAKAKIEGLRGWWEQRTCSWRSRSRLVLSCSRVSIYVGTLGPVS